MRPLLTYGGHLVGSQLVASMARNVDSIVMGYRFGPTPTGLYSRAFDLVINTLGQVNSPSTKVAVPVLSRLQGDEPRFTAYLLRGQRALLFATIPMICMGAALAEPLVRIALGDQWLDTAPYVQIIAIGGLGVVLPYSNWWFALARGRTDVAFRVSLLQSALITVAILAGSAWGPLGIAWGYALGRLGSWPIGLLLYGRFAGAPTRRLFFNALTILLLNTIPTAGVALSQPLLASGPLWASLAAGITVYLLLLSGSCLSIPVFRREAEASFDLARRLLRK